MPSVLKCMSFTGQPAHILPYLLLIVLCLCQLFYAFFHLFFYSLHPVKFQIRHPLLFPLIYMFFPLICGYFIRDPGYFLFFRCRKRFDLLCIRQMGSYHTVFSGQLFDFQFGFPNLFQTAPHITHPLSLIPQIDAVTAEYGTFPELLCLLCIFFLFLTLPFGKPLF